MKIPMMLVGAALLSVFACAAPSTAADPPVPGDIAWRADPATSDGGPLLRVSRKTSSSDVVIDGTRSEFADARAALGGGPGPISFTIVHEAGTLACSGRLTGAFDGENCRGAEKVTRLRAMFGDDVRLAAAYGDTSGDTEMLELAEEKGYRVFTARP